jgi:2'-5' RNA ligase
VRLFLAAELPAALRERVVEVRDELAGVLRGWRWVRPEGIHLTLRFLGEVDEAQDLAARSAWRDAVASVSRFHVRLAGTGRFPERGRAHVLWVGIEETEPGGALATLAATLEAAARELGWAAETRGFHPHLTLARRARAGRADDPTGSVPGAEAAGWVREVILFRSRLERGGASYTALDSFPLGE